MTRKALTITTLLAATLTPIAAAGPGVDRERGADTDALREIEGKPIDQGALGALTDWTHTGVLEDTEGKVALIAVVSSLEPKSWMTLSKLTRIARDHEGGDLVVYAVHPDAGWDGMMEKVNDGRVTIPVARDEGGAFAKAVQANDYPDVFIVDKAGQLRYADVSERGLSDTVGMLMLETPELAVAHAAIEASGGTPDYSGMEPEALTADEIPSSLYASADWPRHNAAELSATNDLQGKPLGYTIGAREEWIANRRDLDDKVIVIDFWATWCGPCLAATPTLKALQTQHEGKLEIVGIGGMEDRSAFVNYLKKHEYNYAQMFDARQTLSNIVGVRGIPHVMIISTDGVVRWQGNPLNPNFSSIVGQVVRADPLVSQID